MIVAIYLARFLARWTARPFSNLESTFVRKTTADFCTNQQQQVAMAVLEAVVLLAAVMVVVLLLV
jgi:hypothetical protein